MTDSLRQPLPPGIEVVDSYATSGTGDPSPGDSARRVVQSAHNFLDACGLGKHEDGTHPQLLGRLELVSAQLAAEIAKRETAVANVKSTLKAWRKAEALLVDAKDALEHVVRQRTEAEAVVDKLQKLADGTPCWPSMDIWDPESGEWVLASNMNTCSTDGIAIGGRVEDFYPTPEAAEAAITPTQED